MTEETESASAEIIPPIEYLRECFWHCPDTGRLIWRDRPLHHFPNEHARNVFKGKGYIGQEFGKIWHQKTTKKPGGKRGRLIFQGTGYSVQVHRIIWMLHFGPIPSGLEVDHKDNNPLNNRLDNLRLGTHSQNIANASDYRRKHKFPRGVYRTPNGKFQSSIRKDGRLYFLGTFPTAEEAHEAFLEKAKELHGEFGNHWKPKVPPQD